MLAPEQQQSKKKKRCLSKNALVEYPQEKKSEDLNVKAWSAHDTDELCRWQAFGSALPQTIMHIAKVIR